MGRGVEKGVETEKDRHRERQVERQTERQRGGGGGKREKGVRERRESWREKGQSQRYKMLG